MSKYVPRSQLSPEALARARRRNKYYIHMNKLGHRFRCDGEYLEALIIHVRYLTRTGMSVGDIREKSGIAEMTIRAIRDGDREWVAQRVEKALLAVEPADTHGNQRVPFFPVQRRVRGLFCDGYTFTYMAEPIGWQANALWRLAHGYGMRGGSFNTQDYVYLRTADTVQALYDKLAGSDPLHHGVPKKQVTYARKRGETLGWVPSHCWDYDTIDDPEALPEWTGHCGTEQGYRLHVSHGIKVCPPCHAAHYGKG